MPLLSLFFWKSVAPKFPTYDLSPLLTSLPSVLQSRSTHQHLHVKVLHCIKVPSLYARWTFCSC